MSSMKSTIGHLIRRIAGELGVGVLLIEHNIGLVLELCESIFVLDSARSSKSGFLRRSATATRSGCLYGTQRDEVIPALASEMGAHHDAARIDDITVSYGA